MYVYKIRHFFFSFFRVSSAARVACSKTSRTPSFVLAEHSRYFWAPIFLRTSSAYVHIIVNKLLSPCVPPIGCGLTNGHAYLLGRHRLLRSLMQLLNGLLVVSQILLAADEDNGEALAEMEDL